MDPKIAPHPEPVASKPTGILNIDKPTGITSHDVVGRVRRITGIRRVGHAGTLDPAASGVLLVCVGLATRLAEYLTGSEKIYDATIRFGLRTATDDLDGEIVATGDPSAVNVEVIQSALADFLGPQLQVPPAYSAIKVAGERLYNRARAGEEIHVEPRPVEFYELTLESWDPPDAKVLVRCSKGTYVRALARDLGEKLGCGATLAALRRVASGSFGIETAVTLDELQNAAQLGEWERFLYPMEKAVADWPALLFDLENVVRLTNGLGVAAEPPAEARRARIHDAESGAFVALANYDDESREWRPTKVFKR